MARKNNDDPKADEQNDDPRRVSQFDIDGLEQLYPKGEKAPSFNAGRLLRNLGGVFDGLAILWQEQEGPVPPGQATPSYQERELASKVALIEKLNELWDGIYEDQSLTAERKKPFLKKCAKAIGVLELCTPEGVTAAPGHLLGGYPPRDPHKARWLICYEWCKLILLKKAWDSDMNRRRFVYDLNTQNIVLYVWPPGQPMPGPVPGNFQAVAPVHQNKLAEANALITDLTDKFNACTFPDEALAKRIKEVSEP